MRTFLRRGAQVAVTGRGTTPMRPPLRLSIMTSSSSSSFAEFFGFGKKKNNKDGGSQKSPAALDESVPPMMQWNEQLVNAGLLLLNAASARESELTPEDEAALSNVATVLFAETYATHVEQFDVIYAALERPAVRNVRELEKAVMLVLEMVVPPPVYGVFVAVDVFTGLSEEERSLFRSLVIILIDGEGDETELHAILGKIEAVSPSLMQLPAFSNLIGTSEELLLKARLYSLITQTCLAFDPDRTGKILISDLQPSLQSVLGEKEGAELVAQLQPDKNGAVFYAQLSKLLLHRSDSTSRQDEGGGDRGSST